MSLPRFLLAPFEKAKSEPQKGTLNANVYTLPNILASAFCTGHPQYMGGSVMLAVVGHNSSNYGQLISELDEGTSRMKPPARTGRFPFFKFYPRDWLESTRHMTLEERGAYIDVICILMEMEGHLANDDDWMRHQLHIPKQRWRKMKGKLLDHEKIRIEDGCIVNDRCVKELADLMGKREQNSKNVQKRWEKVQEKSEQSSKKVETFSPEKSEKPNKNNDSDDTNVSLRALAKDSDLEEERKKESPPASAGPPPQGHGRKKSAPKFRLAEDWCLDFEWRSRTKQKFGITDIQIDKEAERFKRYWTSPDAKNPRKADWWRTWENWIDRALERGISSKSANGSTYGFNGAYVGKLI